MGGGASLFLLGTGSNYMPFHVQFYTTFAAALTHLFVVRVLHTSDWHLGQKFMTQTREPEQQMALDWLFQQVLEHQPDVLIVAGDIYDVSNPPTGAEEMYYRFLTRMAGTSCQHIVIIGGNHDSPYRLNAPRGLLRALRIYVVGAATDNPEDEIIRLTGPDGQISAVIAAVPFLRERDFNNITVSGENADDRIRRIQQGIIQHYEQVAAAIGPFEGPVIATGHLFAKGASSHEEQQNIYLGNLDNIAADEFPQRFNYIALGHIHRMQKVGKTEHIRYCGSLIPLSFSEKKDKKGIIIADFDATGLVNTREIEAPVFRKLVTIKGTLQELEQQLTQLHDPLLPLPSWVEIILTGAPGIALPDRHLREYAEGLHLEILKIKMEYTTASLSEQVPKEDLMSLSPDEVFLKKCASAGLTTEKTTALQREFEGLKEWMNEQNFE